MTPYVLTSKGINLSSVVDIRLEVRTVVADRKRHWDTALHRFALDQGAFGLSTSQSKKSWDVLRARFWYGWVLDRQFFQVVMKCLAGDVS